MSKLRISRNHQLGLEDCRALAEDLLEQLVTQYGGKVKPEGDNLCYRHTTGMSAVVEPKSGELDVTVKLNLMTRSFGPQIEEQINRVLDKRLG